MSKTTFDQLVDRFTLDDVDPFAPLVLAAALVAECVDAGPMSIHSVQERIKKCISTFRPAANIRLRSDPVLLNTVIMLSTGMLLILVTEAH